MKFSGYERQVTLDSLESYIDTNALDSKDSITAGIKYSEAYNNYFKTDEERLAKAREIEERTGIKASGFIGDTKAYAEAVRLNDEAIRIEKLVKDYDPFAKVDMAYFWEQNPELKRIAELEPIEAAQALHKIEETRTYKDIIKAATGSYNTGIKQHEIAMLDYKEMPSILFGGAKEELTAEEIELRERLKKEVAEAKQSPSFIDNPLVSMASGVGHMASLIFNEEVAKDTAIGAGIGTAFAFAGGNAVGGAVGAGYGALRSLALRSLYTIISRSVNKEILKKAAFTPSTLKLLAGGAKSGMQYAIAKDSIGRHYSQYKEMGLDDNAAAEYAVIAGNAEAFIEMASFGSTLNLLKPTPMAEKVIAGIIENHAIKRELIGKALIAGKGKEFLKNIGIETAEEAMQSISDDIIHNRILNNYEGAKGEKISVADMFINAGASSLKVLPGVLGFSLLGLGGSGITSAGKYGYSQVKAIDKVDEDFRHSAGGALMVEKLQEAVQKGELKDTAPDVQRKVMREQLKDSEFHTGYIDVEMVLNQESGYDSLKEIASVLGTSDSEFEEILKGNSHMVVPVEVLAQTKAGTDILEATSFDPNKKSVARARAEMASSADDILKIEEEKIKRFNNRLEGILSEHFPEKGSRERELATSIITENPLNPHKVYKGRYQETKDELDKELKPIIKALEDGMEKGVDVIYPEEMNSGGIRVSNNDPWYSKWYRDYGKKPTKSEITQLAKEILTGEAPSDYIPSSLYDLYDMPEEDFTIQRDKINSLDEQLEILERIAPAMKKLNGVAMELTDTLSKEGYKVYNRVRNILENATNHGVGESVPKNGLNQTKNTAFSGVVVTGNEFGEYKDIVDLREKAKEFYDTTLRNKVKAVNPVLGEIDFHKISEVEFRRTGRKKSINTSAKVNKLLTLKYIKELIETATNIRGEASTKEKHKDAYFYYLETNVKIHNVPELVPVTITLIKSNNGLIQYKNHILPTEEKEDTLEKTAPVSSNEALGSPPVNVSSVTQSIADTDANDNLELLNAMGIIDKSGDSKESVKLTGTLNAILFARHADIFAQKVRDVTGKKYTALDYLNDVVIRFGGNVDSVALNALREGINLDDKVNVVDISNAIPKGGNNAQAVLAYLQKLVANEKGIATADNKAFVSVLPKDIKHITYSSKPKMSFKEKSDRNKAVYSLEDLISGSVLVESIPNTKQDKKPKVNAYHRFYIPTKVGDRLYTVRLVVEEQKGGVIKLPSPDVNVYDVIIENYNKKSVHPARTGNNQNMRRMGTSENEVTRMNALTTVTIREMLSGVKGADKKFYIDEIEGQNEVNQAINNTIQGQFAKGKGKYQGKRIISLFETADESTFSHEMAHLFLDDLRALAELGDKQSQTDYEAVRKWAGYSPKRAKEYKGSKWEKEFQGYAKEIEDAKAKGDNERLERLLNVWEQERFARAFELYLHEGIAPAEGLKRVFAKFRKLLHKLYMAFKLEGGRASKSVQRIMDRMVASDKEIEESAIYSHYNTLSRMGGKYLLADGMDKFIDRLESEGREEAQNALRGIIAKDYKEKWQKEIDELGAERLKTAKAALDNNPVYLAEQLLKSGGDKEDVKEFGFESHEKWQEARKNLGSKKEALKKIADNIIEELEREYLAKSLTEDNINKAMNEAKYQEILAELEVKIYQEKIQGVEYKIQRIADKINNLDEGNITNKDKIDSVLEAVLKLRYSKKWTAKEYKALEKMLKANNKQTLIEGLNNFRKIASEIKLSEESVIRELKSNVKDNEIHAEQMLRTKPLAEATNSKLYRRKEKNWGKAVENALANRDYGKALKLQKERAMLLAYANVADRLKGDVTKLINKLEGQLKAKTVRLPVEHRYWHRHLAYQLRIAKHDVPKPEGGLPSLENLQESLKVDFGLGGDFYLPGILFKINDKSYNGGGYMSLTLPELETAIDGLTVIYTTGKDKFSLKSIEGVSISDAISLIKNDSKSLAGHMPRVNKKYAKDDTGGLNYSSKLSKVLGHKLTKKIMQGFDTIQRVEDVIAFLGKDAERFLRF